MSNKQHCDLEILKTTDTLILNLLLIIRLIKKEDRYLIKDALINNDTFNLITLIINTNAVKDDTKEGKLKRIELLNNYLIRITTIKHIIKIAVESKIISIQTEARFALITDSAVKQATAWRNKYVKQLTE